MWQQLFNDLSTSDNLLSLPTPSMTTTPWTESATASSTRRPYQRRTGKSMKAILNNSILSKKAQTAARREKGVGARQSRTSRCRSPSSSKPSQSLTWEIPASTPAPTVSVQNQFPIQAQTTSVQNQFPLPVLSSQVPFPHPTNGFRVGPIFQPSRNLSLSHNITSIVAPALKSTQSLQSNLLTRTLTSSSATQALRQPQLPTIPSVSSTSLLPAQQVTTQSSADGSQDLVPAANPIHSTLLLRPSEPDTTSMMMESSPESGRQQLNLSFSTMNLSSQLIPVSTAMEIADLTFTDLISPAISNCYDLSRPTPNLSLSSAYVLSYPTATRNLSLSEMTMYSILHNQFTKLMKSQLSSISNSISVLELHSIIISVFNSLNFY